MEGNLSNFNQVLITENEAIDCRLDIYINPAIIEHSKEYKNDV
jgi:hypothetical protein